MKKLILGLLVALTFIGCCQRAEAMSSDGIRSEIRCNAGYKFLYVWERGGRVVTVVQILERWTDVHDNIDYTSIPQPMKCN